MKDVAEKVDKKDTENKRFIAYMATLATIVVGGRRYSCCFGFCSGRKYSN